MRRVRLPWALLAVLVLAQICYPLTGGATRAGLTVATVVLGWLLSVGHALLTRGTRAAAALVAVATGGGFAVEALGVATGFPFGSYDYSGELGPKLAGVPLIIPLAWTWMAWPAWLTAVRLTQVLGGGPSSTGGVKKGPLLARVALAAVGLAAWDLFLDPQMVAEGYWTWRDATPALPGLPGIPVSNYLGWLGFAVLLAAALRPLAGASVDRVDGRDADVLKITSQDKSDRDDHLPIPTRSWDPGADHDSFLDVSEPIPVPLDAFADRAGTCDPDLWRGVRRLPHLAT
ncbi:carotenoid biosynthesis protein [Micromonospora maritima]|uniref:carotenoid biosynthesis protein n=1 Tax=Micromonospora maritima TaxID=986711 RepID=UPI001FE7F4C9|nr:carotenoid biosynthesis protein [Micromonospora maritima]